MGDMSDLPNFKRSWIRRVGIVRLAVVVMVIVTAAIAFGSAQTIPGQNLSLRLVANDAPAQIGSPYTVQAIVKNDDAQTARLEVQGVLYAAASSCLEHGKHLTMSTPVTLNVGPNATVTTELRFDVAAPCNMSAGLKAFVNGSIDSKRFSVTLDTPLLITIR
jgi:hypothetical protein